MRLSWKTLVAAVASSLVVPQLATADDVQEQLRTMQERMQQLEDNLQATNDQLKQAKERVQDQQQVIERAGLDDQRSGLSALSKFLNETEFTGFAASSYTWNFADPSNTDLYAVTAAPGSGTRVFGTAGGEGNVGPIASAAPFHSFHNNFQVDQLWFGMAKKPTPESRGGFEVDVVYGVSADNQTTDPLTFGLGSDGNQAFIHQAYVSYLAPIALGNGVLVSAGRYATLLGGEVFEQIGNFNITRGLVWSLQPVEHTGVMLMGELEGGFYWGLGAANDITGTNVDFNNTKSFMPEVGWANDQLSVELNGHIGWGETGFAGLPTGQTTNRDKGLLTYTDLVVTFDPSDNLSLWLNFDWIHSSDDLVPTTNPSRAFNVYATAVAGRLALSEQTGVATRFEYVRGTEICGAAVGLLASCAGGNDDAEQYSITLTLDHHLTENLMVRGEYRYDYAHADNSTVQDFFVGEDDFGKDNQHLAIVEMSYAF